MLRLVLRLMLRLMRRRWRRRERRLGWELAVAKQPRPCSVYGGAATAAATSAAARRGRAQREALLDELHAKVGPEAEHRGPSHLERRRRAYQAGAR